MIVKKKQTNTLYLIIIAAISSPENLFLLTVHCLLYFLTRGLSLVWHSSPLVPESFSESQCPSSTIIWWSIICVFFGRWFVRLHGNESKNGNKKMTTSGYSWVGLNGSLVVLVWKSFSPIHNVLLAWPMTPQFLMENKLRRQWRTRTCRTSI